MPVMKFFDVYLSRARQRLTACVIHGSISIDAA
jgi:hypothetical protein